MTRRDEGAPAETAQVSLVARTLHGIFDAMRRGAAPAHAGQHRYVIVAGRRADGRAAIVDSYVEQARSSAPAGTFPVGIIDSMDIVKANPIFPGTDRPAFYDFRMSHREV